MHIARRFLLPKQLKSNGLDASHITVTEPVLFHNATRYTAGVQSLERALQSRRMGVAPRRCRFPTRRQPVHQRRYS
jgi:ATP-dependent Lon protease